MPGPFVGPFAVYYHPLFLEHDTGDHPERKERLIAARQALLDSDLDLEWVEPVPASVAAVTRVHDPLYVEVVRKKAASGGGWLDWDTAISPRSYEAALLAAGSGLMAVERCLATGQSAFLLVRPPGHHATPSHGMGFCLFNNIAVAAASALEERGLERVLIVDWDVHHGNGTQDAFYGDPRVLYFSLHEGNHYPGTGLPGDVGTDLGAGYSVNIPLHAGASDGAVRLAFESVLAPLALAFKPDLTLVSAGYDGQSGDPLGDLSFSQTAFQWMAASLLALSRQVGACGPLFFLEGGYVPEMLASSIVATLRGLSEGIPPFDPSPSDLDRADVRRTLEAVQPHWSSAF